MCCFCRFLFSSLTSYIIDVHLQFSGADFGRAGGGKWQKFYTPPPHMCKQYSMSGRQGLAGTQAKHLIQN